MFNAIRIVSAVALLAAPLGIVLKASAADVPKAEKKDDKFKPPKLPESYGKPEWDVKGIEERVKIIRCEVEQTKKLISFVVELKEDEPKSFGGVMTLYDKDGIKVDTYTFGVDPPGGKKGDKVRLTVGSALSGSMQDSFSKSAKVKFTMTD